MFFLEKKVHENSLNEEINSVLFKFKEYIHIIWKFFQNIPNVLNKKNIDKNDYTWWTQKNERDICEIFFKYL